MRPTLYLSAYLFLLFAMMADTQFDPESIDPSSETHREGPASNKPISSMGGPLNLEQIRRLRELQTAEPIGERGGGKRRLHPPPKNPENREAPVNRTDNQEAVPSEPSSPEDIQAPASQRVDSKSSKKQRSAEESFTATPVQPMPKVEKPNLRRPMSADLEQELASAFIDTDLKGMMIGEAALSVGRSIEEGSRHRGRIIKLDRDHVFVSLGGPDEGVIPLLQFNDMPKVDVYVDCLVRSFNADDGLYELALPGEATAVDDWSDIQEGLIVEATVESSNTGGLECKVGGIRGFIPMRQISEFRVEDVSGYIGKRLTCVVMEANPQRGNLVLSHRAVLERERQEKRAERLANLEVGQTTEGIVRKIMDFGAFVDIGGLDGLIHVSQLSYERIKHPSEILKEGDKIQVRVEKVDPDTGKIGLSYRSLQEHPWSNVETRFPVGAVVKGTVSRIANFGAFVKIATGIEGLIHVSELAHRRIATVSSVVEEGQEVEVKILTVDGENQRIGLSLKAVQAAPEPESPANSESAESEESPARAPVIGKYRGPLRGGAGADQAGGERFGLKW